MIKIDQSLTKDNLNYYRIALLFVAIGFPLIGIFTNILDKEMYDPMSFRIILSILVLSLLVGTYISNLFVEKFYFFFNPILFLILLWTCHITFQNNLSISTTLFFIAAIAIISFALNSYIFVVAFFVLTFTTTLTYIFFYKNFTIVSFSLMASIFFIQTTALVVILSKNKSEQKLKKYTTELQKLNEDKGLFIRILAHDLRSPISGILGISEQLLKNFHIYDNEKIKSQLIIKNEAIKRTHILLDSLLLWSKSQVNMLSFNPQQVNVKEICCETINSMKANIDLKNIQVNYFEDQTTTITADINMFNVILRNLISNAIKFTNENGIIQIFTVNNHNSISITISDNGVGISNENIDKLWDISKLTTTQGTKNESGTGLGLILCKDFIEKHGGSISVESKVGKGSNFVVSFPKLNSPKS
jgi:signal transduction histidine kinase